MEPAQPPNPYAAPQADLGAGGALGLDGQALTEEEIYAFVDDNVGYYKNAWDDANRTGGFYAGFNFPALLVGGLWVLYRKMYLVFVVVVAAQWVLAFTAALAASLAGVDPQDAALAAWPAMLLGRVVLAFLANGLYLQRARRVVRAARAAGNGAINPPFLKTRGGTSGAAVVVGIAINAAITFLSR